MNVAIKEEGAGVILKGMPTMVCKRALDWGMRFIFMRMWREGFQSRKAPGEKLSDIERLISYSPKVFYLDINVSGRSA